MFGSSYFGSSYFGPAYFGGGLGGGTPGDGGDGEIPSVPGATAERPRSALSLGGSVLDPTSYTVQRTNLIPFAKDGVPSFRFARRQCCSFPPRPDPWLGREIDVYLDFGHGGVHVFRGDILDRMPHNDGAGGGIGYIYEYMALGLRDRGDRVPLVDDNTGGDSTTFNMAGDDENPIPSRMGRTVGQMILSILEGEKNSANLRSLGIGKYVSNGTGAVAVATLSGGSVGSASVIEGGTGYDRPPSVVFAGGDPDVPATGHATVSGGAVTGVVIDDPGSGYKSTPSILLSQLPTPTLDDLGRLTFIPPYAVTWQGERLLSAIEGPLKQLAPHHFLHVMPDGTLRFFDVREFGKTDVTIAGDGAGAKAAALVRNGEIVEIHVINGGSGYTTATVSIADSGGGSGAAATAIIVGGSITDIVVDSTGSGYSGSKITLTMDIDPIHPVGLRENIGNCFQRLVIRGGEYIEPVELSLAEGTLQEDFAHSGLDNDEAKEHWRLADWQQPGLGTGAARAEAIMAPAAVASLAFNPATDGGSGYTDGTHSLAFSGGGGSGAAGTFNVSGGKVTSVTLTLGGSTYSSPPSVSFAAGGGTGAKATAVLAPRPVSSINLIDGGYGYSSAPVVVLAGGGGSGATAHVTMTGSAPNQAVSAITLDTGGSAYTTAPAVRIGAPAFGNEDTGDCTCPSTVSVEVTSDDPTRSWPENFWDQTEAGKHGVISVSYTAIAGIEMIETRRVVANTALTPGGTSTLTLDRALPTTNYDRYVLRGLAGGSADVWRKYRPTDPAIAAAMTDRPFTYGYPFRYANDTAITLTYHNSAVVWWSLGCQPPYQQTPVGVEIDPEAGVIRTSVPTVIPYSSQATLKEGGSAVDGVPCDVRVVVGIYKGLLQVVCPEDDESGNPQYDGDTFDDYGLTRTKTIQIRGWRDKSQQNGMQTLACDYLDAYKDASVTGTISYDSIFVPAVFPGCLINVECPDGETGWEDINIPVVSLDIKWINQGALIHSSDINVSNQRQHYSGQDFLTPAQTGDTIGIAGLTGDPWMAGDPTAFGGMAPEAAQMGMNGMGMNGDAAQTLSMPIPEMPDAQMPDAGGLDDPTRFFDPGF